MKHGTPSQANRGPKNPGRSGGVFWMDGTKHEQELERAFSNFAAKASAEAVSLEKSYVFGFGFCAP